MKRFWTISLAVLLVVAVTVPALAWEFSMTGQHEYRLRYWSRTGNHDLFGDAAVSNSSGAEVAGVPFVGFAGPNAWGSGAVVPKPGAGGPNFQAGIADTGERNMITRGGFARYESDAIYPDMRLTFTPEWRVNQAIRVHGVYNVGGIRNKYAMFSNSVFGNADNSLNSGVGMPPFERYIGQSALTFSSQDTIGIGSWEQVRATVQTPIGILSYGLKDFPYGQGLFTTARLRGSAFVLVVPYGPFRFIPAFWEGYSTWNGVNGYDFRPDAQDKATWFGGILFTYAQGDFEFGGGYIGRNQHTNRAQAAAQGVSGGMNGIDAQLQIWSFYFKYFNGRFFANGGYEWATNSSYYLLPYGGTALSPTTVNTALQRPGDFCELYHLLAEVGMMAGPTKVTLMWAQSNGPVLNNNNVYSRTQGANPNVTNGVNPKNYGLAQGTLRPGYGWGIDYQNLDPYNYLMFGTYGGGNQSFYGLFLNDDTKGMMSDAYAFGLHADYAVASNLNVWGSYIWAHRLEAAGNFMGMFMSDGRYATAAQRTAFRNQIGSNPGNGGDAYVPNGYIGWELGLGVDWKILEGLTYRARYAYWQPGDWFTYAYQAIMPVGNAWTANGCLSSRDAIQAFEGALVIDF